MEPSFIRDYLLYNSGNECPLRYHLWVAHFLLSATMGRRVYIDMGYYNITPELYITLVGDMGSRKTTAKDIGKDFFVEANPTSPLGANVQSREKIMELLSGDDNLRAFTDESGTAVEFHPMTFFINELKNFLSINPANMIEFLTDIYGQRFFHNSTLKHGEQIVVNPCINILACATPPQIIKSLKLDLFGGFVRRMMFVYATEQEKRVTFPTPTEEGHQARKRCLAHLVKIKNYVGAFKWTEDARRFYDTWYQSLKAPDDPVLKGYYTSKHDQLLKLVMGLCMSETEPKLLITTASLEIGLATLDKIEDNLPKLSLAAGRNELAVPQQKLLDLIERNGGWMSEKEVQIKMTADLGPSEMWQSIRFLKETGQLILGPAQTNGCIRQMLCTPKKYYDESKKGSFAPKPASPAPTQPSPLDQPIKPT